MIACRRNEFLAIVNETIVIARTIAIVKEIKTNFQPSNKLMIIDDDGNIKLIEILEMHPYNINPSVAMRYLKWFTYFFHLFLLIVNIILISDDYIPDNSL